MNAHRTAAVAAALALMAMLPGQRSAAQMRSDFARNSVAFTVRAGPSMPVNKLADITSPGAALGADVAYSLTNRLAVTADGDVDFLTGHQSLEPDLRLWHYGGGLQLELAPQRTPWSVLLSGGANATTMDSSPIGIQSSAKFNHTYFGVDGGLEVGYDVSDNVDVAVRGSSYFVFADKTDTQQLVSGTGVQPFDMAVTVPVTAELHIALPNG